MKLLSIALIFFTTVSLQAASNSEQVKSVLEAQPYCQNFVRADQNNLYFGFGPYRLGLEEPRQAIPSKFRVAPLDGSAPYELATNDSTIDVVTVGSTAYVLTHSSIEEWDLTNRRRVAEYATYAAPMPLQFKQHAEAMALYKNKLIIAHGRLGVSFFDLSTKHLKNQFRLIKNQYPLESMAVGVTVQGNIAYVAMDNFTLANPGEPNKTFRGIVTINLDSETVVSQLGGMDPGADSINSDSKKVIVSFGGIPIWKYNRQSLSGNKLPEPELRIWRFPLKGHPTGAATMDDKYYYTCFSRPPNENEPQGLMIRVPMAIDRRVLMLD